MKKKTAKPTMAIKWGIGGLRDPLLDRMFVILHGRSIEVCEY